MNITAQELGYMYKVLEKAVVSGDDVAIVYHLKMKLIGILKAMEESRPKTETPAEAEAPKVEAEVVPEGTLDMK